MNIVKHTPFETQTPLYGNHSSLSFITKTAGPTINIQEPPEDNLDVENNEIDNGYVTQRFENF